MQRLPASCRLETGRAAPSSLSFCTLVGPMIDHACLRLPSLPLRYRYLLLCGSVVIYVREGMQHKEFYEYGLLPGVHYVAVDTAADVPAMVRWLKQHDDYARAVALAGRARMATLDIDAVADFMAELLSQYARKQTFRPRPAPGAPRPISGSTLWSPGRVSGALFEYPPVELFALRPARRRMCPLFVNSLGKSHRGHAQALSDIV